MPLKPRFITAITTMLQDDDTLHIEGLHREIEQQLDAGINGLLVGGTMGAMQALDDDTYHELARHAVEQAKGRCEVMVGAGDISLSRTLRRVDFLNELPVDGVVVLAPFLFAPSQNELVDYYTALADRSKAPLFLYDLPQLTRTKIEFGTVLTLSRHPNIRGIKCSDEPAYARQLKDEIGDRFRVIIAQPLLVDVFLRYGIEEHLDGFYCICPRHIAALGGMAARGDWDGAARVQQGIDRAMRLVRKWGVWEAINALLTELGVPGRILPRPFRLWNADQKARFCEAEETQGTLRFLRAEPGM
jgi:4-hydroxy-tetrahydrodipicolinate synthase